MTEEVKKIYDFVKKHEDFYSSKIEETNEPGAKGFIYTIQAASFGKVRYFIEEMEAHK